MTRDKYPYWYFKNIIGPKTCDDIIRLALEKQPKLAETDGYKQKLVSKKNMLKKRYSETVFLKEKWIENILFPIIQAANNNATWNYKIDCLESAQFTIYKANQFYGWHQDCQILSHPYKEHSIKEENGKLRKISLSCQLNDSSEFKGGEFEFDFRNYDPNKRKKKQHEKQVTELSSKGDVIVFPSYLWHRVKPVTKGIRYSLVMWTLGEPWQ